MSDRDYRRSAQNVRGLVGDRPTYLRGLREVDYECFDGQRIRDQITDRDQAGLVVPM